MTQIEEKKIDYGFLNDHQDIIQFLYENGYEFREYAPYPKIIIFAKHIELEYDLGETMPDLILYPPFTSEMVNLTEEELEEIQKYIQIKSYRFVESCPFKITQKDKIVMSQKVAMYKDGGKYAIDSRFTDDCRRYWVEYPYIWKYMNTNDLRSNSYNLLIKGIDDLTLQLFQTPLKSIFESYETYRKAIQQSFDEAKVKLIEIYTQYKNSGEAIPNKRIALITDLHLKIISYFNENIKMKTAENKREKIKSRYYLKSRPFMIGTAPDPDKITLTENWNPSKENNYSYGFVEYSEKLSFENIHHYSLEPENAVEKAEYVFWKRSDYSHEKAEQLKKLYLEESIDILKENQKEDDLCFYALILKENSK